MNSQLATFVFSLFAASISSPFICAQEARMKPFALPAGEVKIKDLIDQCAKYIDVNILSIASECADVEPITLHKAIQTDTSGCEEVLTSLLSRSGLALTVVDKKHDLFEVVRIDGARGRVIRNRSEEKSVESILARPNLVVPVTTVVTLKHIRARNAVNNLKVMYTRGSGYELKVADSGSNATLIIDGMQNEVARVIRTIRSADIKESGEYAKDLQSRLDDYARRIRSLEKKLKEIR